MSPGWWRIRQTRNNAATLADRLARGLRLREALALDRVDVDLADGHRPFLTDARRSRNHDQLLSRSSALVRRRSGDADADVDFVAFGVGDGSVFVAGESASGGECGCAPRRDLVVWHVEV